MQSLRQFYNENKDKIKIHFNTLRKYVKMKDFDGLIIVENKKRDTYYVSDKDLFLANFK